MGAYSRRTVLFWCRQILYVAGWIVPRDQRCEWRKEWDSEVWHWVHFLGESDRLTVSSEMELMRHCWGSFADALWHRFNREAVLAFVQGEPQGPRFLLACCVLALVTLCVAIPRGSLKSMFESPSYTNSNELLIVSLDQNKNWVRPEALRDAGIALTTTQSSIAAQGAYAYRPDELRGPAGSERVKSARVTPGLFSMLGVRPMIGTGFESGENSECSDCVVINDRIWADQFHRSPRAIGQTLLLHGQRVRVIGIMPATFRLPETGISIFSVFSGTRTLLPRYEWGVLMFRLHHPEQSERLREALVSFLTKAAGLDSGVQLNVESFRDRARAAIETYGMVALLALLVLLAADRRSCSLVFKTAPRDLVSATRWYAFFTAKLLLLLGTACVTALALTYELTRVSADFTRASSGIVTVWLWFVGCVPAVRWSTHDQLARCRRCLRRMTIQLDLATTGRSFLENAGTELVCSSGHGALHVPLFESGTLDGERWAELDPSWMAVSGGRS
jgi:hypothetical protein